MRKRVFSLFMAFAMCLSLIPGVAWAVGDNASDTLEQSTEKEEPSVVDNATAETVLDAKKDEAENSASVIRGEGNTILYGNQKYWIEDGQIFCNDVALSFGEGTPYKMALADNTVYAIVGEKEEWVILDDSLAGEVSLLGNSDNEATIFRFAIDELHVNIAAACGILANIEAESSFNPRAQCIDTNGLTSYGICQWNGGRFTNLKNYCAANGYDYTTINGQLQYLKSELTGSENNAFNKVKDVSDDSTGAYNAGYNWARYFERCASQYYNGRAVKARDTYYPKYKSLPPPPPVIPKPILKTEIVNPPNLNVVFSWNSVANADFYDIEIYRSNDNQRIDKISGIKGTNHSMHLSEGSYYARVGAVNASTGNFTFSDDFQFTVSNKYNVVDFGTDFHAYIIHTATGRYLTSESDGNVTTHSASNSKNQIWKFQKLGNGAYKIIAAKDNKCLDVQNAGKGNGTNVCAANDNGGEAQQWYIYGEGQALALRAICTECVLDVDKGSNAEGTNVQMWESSGGPNQQFKIQKFSATYTVTFDYCGASGSPESKTVTYGQAYGTLPTPYQWVSHQFLGWFTAASGGTQVTDKTTVNTVGNHTLYAHWKYPVSSVDVNGYLDGKEYGWIPNYGTFDVYINGKQEQNDVNDFWGNYGKGTKYEIKDIKAASGKKYLGVKSGSLSGAIGDGLSEIVLNFATLYSVTFNANGGAVSTESKQVAYTDAYGDLPTPTRTGYIFDGWHTVASGGTKVTRDTKVTVATNHTLYAHWSVNDKEAPEITGANLTNISSDKCTFTITATDNVGVNRVDFHVWYDDWSKDSEKIYTPNKSGDNYSYDVPITLSNGKVWTMDARVYDAAGNQTVIPGTSNDAYVAAHLKTITVTFDATQGSCDTKTKNLISAYYALNRNKTYVSNYGDLPIPVRSGYTFSGWYTKESGGEEITKDTKVASITDHTLYAHWTASVAYLDINWILDGKEEWGEQTYGTVDIYVNGNLIKDDCKDYVAEWPIGSSYEIKDIRATSGHIYDGVKDGSSLTGTIGPDRVNVWLQFSTSTLPDTPQIVIANKTASKGSSVDLDVSILNNPGIAGASLTIGYNQSALSLESVTKGALFQSGNYSASPESGVVQWYHTENVIDDGVLFTLHFQLKPEAKTGDYIISIGLQGDIPANLTNQEAEIVTAQFVSGTLTVNAGIRGDVTGDGVVAINDVVKVARAVAGSLTLTEAERTVADVTGDGVIAINDVVKLARYVAGSIATLQSAEVASLSSGESAVIEVATVSGKPGEAVRVPVSIASNPGIAGLQLDVLFDNGLTLKNVVQGDILSGENFTPDVSAGRIQWYYEQANVTNTGVLFTLEFEIGAEAQNGDAYAVTVNVKDGISANLSDYDSNPVNAEFKPGKIQISETADNTAITTVSRNGNTITTNVVCTDSNATVFCAVYNNSGKMIAVRSAQITGESNYQFQFDGQQFDYAKAFIVDGNFCPLCESKKS